MVVVFPEPGGPSNIAKSLVFNAFWTKFLCSKQPLIFSLLKNRFSIDHPIALAGQIYYLAPEQ